MQMEERWLYINTAADTPLIVLDAKPCAYLVTGGLGGVGLSGSVLQSTYDVSMWSRLVNYKLSDFAKWFRYIRGPSSSVISDMDNEHKNLVRPQE